MSSASVLLAIGFCVVLAPLSKADPLVNPINGFAVLGTTAVTNTGASTINGNVGLTAGSTVTGFPPGQLSRGSSIDIMDSAAAQAYQDALSAYTSTSAMVPDASLTGEDLGGLTLTAGIFSFASSAQLTGALVLDFAGENNATFVFQIGSTLTTASGSTVTVENEGTGDTVFWDIGTSATLGTSSVMVGYVIADQSVTLNTGASISCGGAAALNGAVTLDTNTIGDCYTGTQNGTVDLESTSPSATPEPSGLLLLGTGMLGFAGAARRRIAA